VLVKLGSTWEGIQAAKYGVMFGLQCVQELISKISKDAEVVYM